MAHWRVYINVTFRWSGVVACALIAATGAATAGCGLTRPPASASTAPPSVAVTTPAPVAPEKLPEVSGAGVRVLWQGAPWDDLTFAGGTLLGVNGQQVEAVSAATGAPLWTATLPASLPVILGLVPGKRVVIVEAGRQVGQAPAAVYPVVSEYVALDLATGAMRWAVPVGGRYQNPPIAVSGRFLLTGDPAGAVTARIAATGRIVWRDRRPAGCGQPPGDGPDNAGLGLAADGPLLAASFDCGSRVIVQRLDPATGTRLWTWRSMAAGDPLLAVTAAARGGAGMVLIDGQIAPSAWPFTRRLPHAVAWPPALGPADNVNLIVALDAGDGRPGWSETGGQLEMFAPTAGALCEVVDVGLECRDDATGTPAMRTLVTGKRDGDSPPYIADGFAGVSRGLAAVTVPSRQGGVGLLVVRVRGGATVARGRLAIGAAPRDGSNFQVFAVAAAPFGDRAILVLVRRVDLPGYPVLALEVSYSRPVQA